MAEIVLRASILRWHERHSSRLYPHAFSELDVYQSENQDILFPLHFEYLYRVFSSLICLIAFDPFDKKKFMKTVLTKFDDSLFPLS